LERGKDEQGRLIERNPTNRKEDIEYRGRLPPIAAGMDPKGGGREEQKANAQGVSRK